MVIVWKVRQAGFHGDRTSRVSPERESEMGHQLRVVRRVHGCLKEILRWNMTSGRRRNPRPF
jgi:hypothetical protein